MATATAFIQNFVDIHFYLVPKYVMTEALFLRRGLINANAPLKNGLGRFIPQLMRITIKFCKESPTSQGVREFIERDIVEFAKQNPGSAIYLKPRRHRSPVIVAEYRKFYNDNISRQKHFHFSYPLEGRL